MQPHHNRAPYFPANLEDYAPWVATHGLVAPYGKCQCGCGEDAPIAPKSNRGYGYRGKHPKRFCRGHGKRITLQVAPWVKEHGLVAPYGYCQCGCGQKTRIADKTELKKGVAKGQPFRYLPQHHVPYQTVEDGFWKYVSPGETDECWEWQGPIVGGRGYGKFQSSGETLSAHRVSYELHHGPISDGMCVCHTCDNPSCVNPHHLFVGTPADNMADKVRKGRHRRGEETRSAKLTRKDVIKIRSLASAGLSNSEIARRFPVSRRNIRFIVERKTWRHVK